MRINRWWEGKPGEHYWLEVTDRRDLGTDLNAPQLDESKQQKWSYELLKEPADGDVIFHYWKPEQVIVASSIARGPWWEDEVVWGARGTSARARALEPYARPGYRRALQHFQRLAEPVKLDAIMARRDAVLAIQDDLERSHGSPVYFPFPGYGPTLRTGQSYMLKMPVAMVRLLGLPELSRRPEAVQPELTLRIPVKERSTPTAQGGGDYREADERVAVSRAIPMQRDPALVERGLRSHRALQNAVAVALRSLKLRPLSPLRDDPDWDIAWNMDDVFYVCEIKSVTPTNAERQLRLGLGQVLRYRQHLALRGRVVAAIAIESEPHDPSWADLCRSLDVALVWPPNLEAKLAAAIGREG